ncbi:MAG: hypothetical protein AB7T63_14375, partial [Planctomycetota bacterium]
NAEGLEAAQKLLRRRATQRGNGEFAGRVDDYADGLAAVGAGQPEQAGKRFGPVWTSAKKHDWTLFACHVGVEYVAALAATDASKAQSQLESFAAWYLEPSRSGLRGGSNGWVAARMKALPGELPAQWQTLLEAAPSAGGSAGAAGGAGGNAVRPGAQTRVAEVLERAKSSTVLAEVTRGSDGFEIRYPFERAFRQSAEPNKGVGVDHKAEFGITLAIGHAGVRLAMLDLVGNKGQPGGASMPKPFQPLFELAPGETWTLKADGSVTIK